MKVLFISALLPYPLYSGGQIRIYNLLRELSISHDITLLTYIRDKAEEILSKNLTFCRSLRCIYRGRAFEPRYILRSLVHQRSLLTTSYDQGLLQDAVDIELKKCTYDLIHIEPWYAGASLKVAHIPIVSVEHNIEYDVYQRNAHYFRYKILRPILHKDADTLRKEEQHYWKQQKNIVCVSANDAKVIHAISKHTVIHTVPNGVDTRYFQLRKSLVYTDQLRFIYVGNFRWMQNQDAVHYLVQEVWPLIIKKFPNSELRIIGNGIPRDLRHILSLPHVKLLEHIVEIYPEYKNAHALLAPIRAGGGTQYKILESMASGCPVVTTMLGAAGLDTEIEKALYLAEQPEEYVHAVVEMVSNKQLRQDKILFAYDFVTSKYNWTTIAQKLHTVWKNIYESD